jgi:hypothetical protein
MMSNDPGRNFTVLRRPPFGITIAVPVPETTKEPLLRFGMFIAWLVIAGIPSSKSHHRCLHGVGIRDDIEFLGVTVRLNELHF